MNIFGKRAFISGRQRKFSARSFSALLAYFLSPPPALPSVGEVRARRGRESFLRPAGFLPMKAPRGYAIPWHSGKVPPPTIGHHLRPRLTPDRLKSLRAAACA